MVSCNCRASAIGMPLSTWSHSSWASLELKFQSTQAVDVIDIPIYLFGFEWYLAVSSGTIINPLRYSTVDAYLGMYITKYVCIQNFLERNHPTQTH